MIGTEFTRINSTISTSNGAYIGTWELVKQDTSTLLSTIKLRGYIYYWGTSTMKASGGYSFLIDGKTIASGSSYEYGPGYHLLGETTITVAHNSTSGIAPDRSVTIGESGYTHFEGTATGTITAPAIIVPLVKKRSIIAYIKQSGTWKRVTSYIKVNGAFKKSKEYLKEGGTWE